MAVDRQRDRAEAASQVGDIKIDTRNTKEKKREEKRREETEKEREKEREKRRDRDNDIIRPPVIDLDRWPK